MNGPDPDPPATPHPALAALPAARRTAERIWSSGQPDAGQFPEIARAGVHCVINLALPTSPRALPDERVVVEAAGMEYVAIPVVFEAPTEADYLAFEQAMDGRNAKSLLVHCALNYRASAFLALYRVRKLGWERGRALDDLASFWKPEPAWQELIDRILGPASA